MKLQAAMPSLYIVLDAKALSRQLKAMGCRLALDDFGTVYSRLRHLQALLPHDLKIDHSFVGSMANEDENANEL
jgi:EAL domain-containing protein (putative c-di-GMP-specific phosphodiesterase class I)